MHALNTSRKNKIVLSDYNYQRDVDCRLLMAHMTTKEVEVLTEILDGSLKTSISHLIDALDIPTADLFPILDKLRQTNLFQQTGDSILVDKEIRKYLESQINKFDPGHELGMEFLQGLLNKVPPHALPNWYTLPKTTDNIFGSIIEKYLVTPQTYQRYLDELIIDFPHAQEIARDLFKTPAFTLRADQIMAKYKLSHSVFEECILHLEYNFVCCLGYQKEGDRWVEIVTPFHEWRDFLQFTQSTLPGQIPADQIETHYPENFGYLNAIQDLLNNKKEIPLKFMATMQILHLVESDKELSPMVDDWLSLPIQEQAASLYRRLLQETCLNGFSDRDLRHVQRALKRIVKAGWISFDDFIRGFIYGIGQAESTSLRSKGKKWRYQTPVFSPDEVSFIRHAIFDVFMQVGIVATGMHKGVPCFAVTPFGRLSLEE